EGVAGKVCREAAAVTAVAVVACAAAARGDRAAEVGSLLRVHLHRALAAVPPFTSGRRVRISCPAASRPMTEQAGDLCRRGGWCGRARGGGRCTAARRDEDAD